MATKTDHLRWALLFSVAAAPLVGIGGIKPAPLVFGAALFLVHAAMSLVTRSQELSAPRDLLSALLLVGWLQIAATSIVTSLALALTRPEAPDLQRSMPIGEMFIGLIGGVLLGAALAFVALRAAWRERRLERMLLHAVGLAVLVAAVVEVVKESG